MMNMYSRRGGLSYEVAERAVLLTVGQHTGRTRVNPELVLN